MRKGTKNMLLDHVFLEDVIEYTKLTKQELDDLL